MAAAQQLACREHLKAKQTLRPLSKETWNATIEAIRRLLVAGPATSSCEQLASWSVRTLALIADAILYWKCLGGIPFAFNLNSEGQGLQIRKYHSGVSFLRQHSLGRELRCVEGALH